MLQWCRHERLSLARREQIYGEREIAIRDGLSTKDGAPWVDESDLPDLIVELRQPAAVDDIAPGTVTTHDPKAVAPVFDSARLKLAREALGLTKGELAREVGVTPAAIGQYQRKHARARANTADTFVWLN